MAIRDFERFRGDPSNYGRRGEHLFFSDPRFDYGATSDDEESTNDFGIADWMQQAFGLTNFLNPAQQEAPIWGQEFGGGQDFGGFSGPGMGSKGMFGAHPGLTSFGGIMGLDQDLGIPENPDFGWDDAMMNIGALATSPALGPAIAFGSALADPSAARFKTITNTIADFLGLGGLFGQDPAEGAPDPDGGMGMGLGSPGMGGALGGFGAEAGLGPGGAGGFGGGDPAADDPGNW